MNGVRYVCCAEQRRALLVDATLPAPLSGIDYIEVTAGATTADPTLIDIILVKPLTPAPPDLTPDNILLEGGVRFPTPTIDPLVEAQPGAGTVERYRITIPGNQPTDFSTYRLTLVKGSGSADPPDFIDVRFASVDFSFKIGCPADFDCAADCSGLDEPLPPDPAFDYRLRDYQGFRRQMLDRMATLVPGFREDDPVDFTITLLEALAYKADQQSYKLDWVGTEGFLSLARSRTSVARHARLVDYRPGEGSSARVFAQFKLPGDTGPAQFTVPARTPLVVSVPDFPPVIGAAAYRRLLAQSPLIFETAAELTVYRWRNAIQFHTWGDDDCLLPRGSTAVTLVDSSEGTGPLAPGDFLLLQEIKWRQPDTGGLEPGRFERRHVVRLTRVSDVEDPLTKRKPGEALVNVEWSQADALPFDLMIQLPPGASDASSDIIIAAEAHANIMIADHGVSLPPPAILGLKDDDITALRPRLIPPEPVAGVRWRPVLDRADISRTRPFGPKLGTLYESMPASAFAAVDPALCLPALDLDDAFATWTSKRDLLDSSPFDRNFVIEEEIDRRPALRFGDNVNGLSPTVGTTLVPKGRFGFGPPGNIGVHALAHVVLAGDPKINLEVTNPLTANGGAAPQSLDEIRIAAPQAFRRQERAVSAADYAEAAIRHAEVQNAVAVPRWTGAWQTMLVFVDRKGGSRVDAPFRQTMLKHLETYRLMGFDVAVEGARAVPLDIELMVCAKPGELRSGVASRVRETLRPAGAPGEPVGFFHPDNFTFGSPLYLSQLIAAVMAVEGVQSVTARKFQPLGRIAQNELENGVIRPGVLEVLQLDDDPSFPENGRLALAMGGGR